jgi:hypothetical protein
LESSRRPSKPDLMQFTAMTFISHRSIVSLLSDSLTWDTLEVKMGTFNFAFCFHSAFEAASERARAETSGLAVFLSIARHSAPVGVETKN